VEVTRTARRVVGEREVRAVISSEVAVLMGQKIDDTF